MDLAHFWNTSGAYEINQSLRFNTADSAFLNKTYGSAGNRKTWTWSGWIKRGKSGTRQQLFNSTSGAYIEFVGDDTIRLEEYVSGTVWLLKTNAVYRDFSAWYHVVVAFDTTQSTSSNRIKLYINGTQETSFSSSTYPSQNTDGQINTASEHRIAKYYTTSSDYFDGYLAEVNFIDGTALTPSSFGETDTITGAWIPKKYSGSYGTNGFYLKFDPSATNGIGHDHSGNGNNFTATGFSTSGTGTDVMSDTPTNNYATLNAVDPSSAPLSEGNLKVTGTSGGWTHRRSTFAMSSGKWYWEATVFFTGFDYSHTGVVKAEAAFNNHVGQNAYGWGFQSDDGKIYTNGSGTSYGSGVSTGTVLGVAFDADTGKMWIRNASGYYNSGDPVAGTNPAMTAGAGTYFAAGSAYPTSAGDEFNFGQRAFAYTPPTGFKALSTANLPEPTIKKGDKYFDTVLYTGDGGAAKSITGFGFSPDLVWIKSRSLAYAHNLGDTVRGVNNTLSSNSTGAENYAGSGDITAFNSDGFSIRETGNWGINTNTQTYVAWCWDANGAGSSNTAGSITSTVSANATAGFSIATYTGTGSNASFGHGLGVVPSMCIIKQRNTAQSWWVWHQALGNNVGANNTMLELNGTAGTYAADDVFRGFTSSVVNIGTDSGSNTNGGTYVAYCFSEVAGYSKFGSYTGNGSTDGPFVFCGFRPRWVLTKRTDSTSAWYIHDTARNTYNVCNNALSPDLADAEVTANNNVDILSNGFKLKTTGAWMNASGGTYIFAAFSETAFKFANAR